jgi:hypothetical protein
VAIVRPVVSNIWERTDECWPDRSPQVRIPPGISIRQHCSRQTPATPQPPKAGQGRSTCSGILQSVHKLFYANARLTEYALERPNNQVAMHRYGDPPITSGHANMRTRLSGDREAQALRSFERFGSRDVPGQFHA